MDNKGKGNVGLKSTTSSFDYGFTYIHLLVMFLQLKCNCDVSSRFYFQPRLLQNGLTNSF